MKIECETQNGKNHLCFSQSPSSLHDEAVAELLLLGRLVITASNGLQRRSHGYSQKLYYIAIDYDYIKFTFSGCVWSGVHDSEEALSHEQL